MTLLKLLKEKSTCDGWCPQMVSTIPTSLYPVLLVLFNCILSYVLFPTKWCINVVAALFKNKGSPSIAKYYRPVTLVHLLYKWFDFILQFVDPLFNRKIRTGLAMTLWSAQLGVD